MKKISSIIAIAAGLSATSAHAQDPEQLSKFNVGVVTGLDSVSVSEPTFGSESDENVLYGITLGYDHGVGDIFFGIEGEITETEVGVSERDVFVAGDRIGLNATRDLYVGGRIGAYLGDTLSVYAKGGYTNAGVELEYADATTSFDETDELDGYRIGAGLEAAITSNLAIRAEYRFSDYGEYSYAGFATGVSAERHQGVVGVIGRF